jgi:hypothetical protein
VGATDRTDALQLDTLEIKNDGTDTLQLHGGKGDDSIELLNSAVRVSVPR